MLSIRWRDLTRKQELLKAITSTDAAIADIQAKRAVIAEQMTCHTDSLRKKMIADIKDMTADCGVGTRG